MLGKTGMKSILIASVVIAGAFALAACGGPDRATPRVNAASETKRLAALWTYFDEAVANGRQRSATIYSTDDVDTGGQVPRRVRLVFRDHPSWGRSSYLFLEGGDFDCYSGCNVQVKVDNDPPKPMAARRPKTDEAIAMFIDDAHALFRMAAGARKKMSIDFPVKAGGTRSASFEVAGLEPSKITGS
jgi:hypothetical protein